MLVIELKARTSDGGDTMSRLSSEAMSGEGMECDIVWYATRLKALQTYWLWESWWPGARGFRLPFGTA